MKYIKFIYEFEDQVAYTQFYENEDMTEEELIDMVNQYNDIYGVCWGEEFEYMYGEISEDEVECAANSTNLDKLNFNF